MKRFLALAALAIVLSTTAARAMTVDFAFSFTNIFGPAGSGVVTGVVRGLQDNATSAATSVEILTNTEGFGLGEHIGIPPENTWTVESGKIVDFRFVSLGESNSSPAVTNASLAFDVFDTLFLAGLTPNSAFARLGFTSGLTFTALPPSPTTVPLPAPALLLAAAAGSLGLLRRRRAAAA
jgi:hypothetical protein